MVITKYETDRRNNQICYDWVRDVYVEYLKALTPYNPLLKGKDTNELNRIAFENLINTINSVFSDMYLLSSDGISSYEDIIGFAIIGKYPNSYDENSLYIQEFFIRKEYRKKGYGRQFATELLKNTNKNVFYETLNENIIGSLFWKNVLSKMGYQQLRMMNKPHNMGELDEYLTWFYWNKVNE